MLRSLAPRTLLLSLLLPSFACRGEHDPCTLPAADDCDVRDMACIETLHVVVACMRGAEHELPDIEVISPEDYLAQFPAPKVPSPEQAALDNYYYDGLKLLGLLPDDWKISYDPPTSIGSPYIPYSWEDKRLTVVTDRRDPDSDFHAMVYALALADRDAEVDLAARFKEIATYDRRSALTALIAGEGLLYADLAFVWDGKDGADLLDYRVSVSFAREAMADPAATLWGAMSQFQYYYGAHLVHARFLADGPAGIDAAFESAAASSAYALAGPEVEIEAAFNAVDTTLPDPPEGFRYLVTDSLGPAALLSYRMRQSLTTDPAQDEKDLARTWVGDRFIIAADESNGRLAVVWQVAGPAGDIAETILAANDPATEDAFRGLFP